MEFTFFGTSETGHQRDRNEDSYLCNPEERLFLVVDGLGGEASENIRIDVSLIEILKKDL
jgi:serine/threonine protein phosphatase PrpC